MIKQVVSNGCSWMFGMGVSGTDVKKLEETLKLDKSYYPTGGREQNRVSGLFAQKYNAKDINLSLPGGSNDRTLRTTTEWLFQNQKRTLRTQKSRYFSETFVLVGLTQIPRNEVWYHVGEISDMAHYDSAWQKTAIHDGKHVEMDKIFNKYMNLSYKYFHSYQYDYERTLRNIIQLASVCEYYGCKYLIFDALANLEFWSLNGYEDSTENYFHSKFVECDYTHKKFKIRDVIQDRHYDYNKRSLEDIIKSNPNIYLDTTWDQFLGGANSRFTQKDEETILFPKGWKRFEHDEFDASIRSPEWFEQHGEDDIERWYEIYNKDRLYALKDLGHPSAKGNYMWYKHLEKYIEKNKIV